MRKRRTIWVAVGAIALAVTWFAFPRPRNEPTYQSRYLSEWVRVYSSTQQELFNGHSSQPAHQEQLEGAQRAIWAIGTNALPCFLKWMRYETPEWRVTFRLNLPRWARYDWLEEGPAERQAREAFLGMCLLGTNAADAIPELKAMMRDPTRPQTAYKAIRALGHTGEQAIPVLQSALADPNQPYRVYIVGSVFNMAHIGLTNACLPLLVQALTNQDSFARENATNFLRRLAPHLLTNSPASATPH
jgi:hypothetical protein